MSRFYQGLNKGSRGNDPGTGLAACAALDHELKLQELRDLRLTPIRVNGVTYLGWLTMEPWLRAEFLAGNVAYEVL